MEGVTDSVFRRLLLEWGKPDVMFTEFTSVDQLFSPGFDATIQNFEYTEGERPLVAQLWGIEPELYHQAGDVLVHLGFDGVDINFGCPQKAVVSKGACSALINNRELAREIIENLFVGVNDRIPVSVKIRTGWDQHVTEEWVEWLLQFNFACLTVHGRTRENMSKVPADWDEIAKAVEVRNRLGVETVVLGNGDVYSLDDAQEKVQKFGVDGVMVARGIFHNPLLFSGKDYTKIAKIEKISMLKRHVELYQQVWGTKKHYDRLKRFFKIYCSGFPGSSELRDLLMRTKTFQECEAVIADVS